MSWKKEAISEYPATSFTYVSVLWRKRYITIVAILLQWSWSCKKWNCKLRIFTWRSVWFDIHVQHWCFVLSEITRRVYRASTKHQCWRCMSEHAKRQVKWTLFSNMRFSVMLITAVCVLFFINFKAHRNCANKGKVSFQQCQVFCMNFKIYFKQLHRTSQYNGSSLGRTCLSACELVADSFSTSLLWNKLAFKRSSYCFKIFSIITNISKEKNGL